MTYCVTPGCLTPENPDSANFCKSCGAKLRLQERYRPIQAIGKGGFGRAFLAEDIYHNHNCVIKQLYMENVKPEIFQKAKELFHQEAQRLDELGKHPQIPSLLAHFEQNRYLYLIQEWISGQTLDRELNKNGAYNESQIREFIGDMLPILQYIHAHRVIHRDIKPSNIIRRDDGKLFLIDFGVAKLLTDTALLKTGTIIGSPEYMAPEQLRGKAFWASDLYSLGVTCIHLLTQVPPLDMYDDPNDCWMWRDFLLPGIQVSHSLGKILDKLIQHSIKERYQSADEVLASLKLLKSPLQGTNFINIWQPTVTPTITKLVKPGLVSEVGVNYGKLQQLLSRRKWQQADEETWIVMCQALGKTPGYYFKANDIKELPCEDLRTINQLWLKYSEGRFGFTVQAEIYQDVGGDYPSFCDRVGWTIHNSHHPNDSLTFNLKAPLGHLPSRRWVGGYNWWRHAGALAAKLSACGLDDS
ncbi:MAG TPA: serine/threonine protein kinase [Cyanobacteria bacterium UBA11149]|nr:serine/threonine protein kinase [Cyanobacteria bacterium UBA11367]HBE59169.1 serine/threonine protein kinase [Cyanobacteria bacterium UBA11366]HBK64982.1 serine/threonine protein kinase [Cyanobacteria bacterium UBA11166]HBR72733.1 serine/threonine protein kinase [Cyanobacteria bacterium UBA11159]HBS69202.1 serine/threonine protein kinase [Cyanobacteria bacterium UBA11153]HBW90255.1 serine/threonine protein kinase [Cyanobacteria bacterium UBA11149]HCA94095.1 serine/threonine protein kinase 